MLDFYVLGRTVCPEGLPYPTEQEGRTEFPINSKGTSCTLVCKYLQNLVISRADCFNKFIFIVF